MESLASSLSDAFGDIRSASTPGAKPDSAAVLSEQLVQARTALAAGRPEDVVRDLRACLETLSLVEAATYAVLGSAFQQLDRLDDSATAFMRAVELYDRAGEQPALSPTEATAIAPALVALGRRTDAVALLQATVADHPDDVESAGMLVTELAAEGDSSGEVAARLMLGANQLDMGDDAGALATLSAVEDDLPPDDPGQAIVAEALRRQGDVQGALARLDPLRKAAPDNSRAELVWALVQVDLGDSAAALEAFNRVLFLEPDNHLARFSRGSLLMDAADFDAAVTDFEAVAADLPGVPLVQASLGKALASAGRLADALGPLAQAAAGDPDNLDVRFDREEVLRLLGRFDEALGEIDALVALRPDDAKFVGTRGQVHAALNHADAALADFERALTLGGEIAWVLLDQAKLLQILERSDEALAALDRLEAVAPGGLPAAFIRGAALVEKGDGEAALTALAPVLEALPENGPARYFEGFAYMELSRAEDAVRAFDIALAHPEGVALAQANLLRAESLRSLERYPEAIAAYDAALAQAPHDGTALYGRGQACIGSGDVDAAETAFRQAADAFVEPEESASRASALQWLGEARRRRGDLDGAIAALDDALALDPDLAFALATKGQVLNAQGKRDEALALLQQAIAIDPSLAWAQAELGEILRLETRYEEALTALNAAVAGGETAYALGTRGQVFRALDRRDEALADLRKAWSLSHSAWIADELGQLLAGSENRDELNEALTVLDTALSEAPEATDLLRTKADALRMAGRPKEALETVDRYLATNTDDTALGTKAHVLADLGSYDDALALSDDIISRDPSYVFARYGRVRALAGLDRHHEAIAELDAVLAQHPDDPWSMLTKANLLSDLRQFDEALALLRGPLAEDPDDPFANGVAGWCERRATPPALEAAEKHLRRAADMAPDVLWYHGELGVVLDDLGRDDDARATNEAVLSRFARGDLTDASSLAVAGWVNVALGHFDDAITNLQDAIQLDPSALGTRLTLALAFLHAGRGELGVDEYEGCAALAEQKPDPERAAAILTEALDDLRHDAAKLPTNVRDDAAEAERALVASLSRLDEGGR
jgi:tetratricopeptide (TPR) repeat protein